MVAGQMSTDIHKIGESQKTSEAAEKMQFVQIKCSNCTSMNDIEPWMLRCFLEINCIYCNHALNIAQYRKK